MLVYSQQNLKNTALIFRTFGQKYKLLGNFQKILKFFDKNSLKIEFLSICGKVVAKNRAFGNNIIFLQQIFSILGRGTFPVFPLAAPM